MISRIESGLCVRVRYSLKKYPSQGDNREEKVYYNGESEDQREVRGGDRVYYNGDERKGGYVNPTESL